MAFPWKEAFDVENGRFRCFRLGSLELVIAKVNEEWRIAQRRQQLIQTEIPDKGLFSDLPKLDWVRWDASDSDSKIKLLPALPDKQVISRPRVQVMLPPKARASFLIGIAVLVEVQAHCGGTEMSIGQFPSTVLSKTWLGTPQRGELAFSLPTRACRVSDAESFLPGSAICTVDVINQRSETIPFSGLVLNTSALGIYENEKHQLWTNTCRIIATNTVGLERVVYSKKLPEIAGNSKLICEPREAHDRKNSLQRALYSMLTNISGDY